MESFEKFKGKKVLITVAFSGASVNGGSMPHSFIGILDNINSDFLELSDVKKEKYGISVSSYPNYSNSVIINKQYLIMMAEA